MTTKAILAARASVFAVAVVAAIASFAGCHSDSPAEPAKQCADPCCGGNLGVDCAEHPNVACVQDADPCTALAYGCSNGRYYSMMPTQLPVSCATDDSGLDVDLLLGKATIGAPDAGALGD